MSEIRTFFRFCPACGRRFHIKLVNKKLVNLRRESQEMKRVVPLMRPGPIGTSSYYGSSMPIVVQEGEPITIDVEEFQYAYKCKHCGHEWSEKGIEERKER